MDKKAIIHISDLHVMLHTEENGDSKTTPPSSILSTDPALKENAFKYLKKVATHIVDSYQDFELYLIITGDISDRGLKEEFEFAIDFLNYLKAELHLHNNNILIIPGDHDVNWFDCKTAFLNDNKQRRDFSYLEKFTNFSDFYSSFKGLEFIKSAVIVDVLELKNDKIVFIGINSNYKIGFSSGYGFIDIEAFKVELDLIKDKYSDYSKIAVFHSNIVPFYENQIWGQWDGENRNEVIDILKEYQFKVSLFGNEHTSGSKEEGEFYFIEAGSLTMGDTNSQSFKVYEIQIDEKGQTLVQNLHHLINIEKNSGASWSWARVRETDLIRQFKEIDEIKLIIKPLEVTPSVATTIIETASRLQMENSSKTSSERADEEDKKIFQQPRIDFDKNPYHHKIFKRVKKLKIFHSGHFHWSDNSKAHNWIEVAKLLNDKEDVLLCKKAVLDTVVKNEIDFDFIIGLGIEGNILATRTAMVYNKPHSFLPYSYRYEDHADYEQKLGIQNEGFEKILIITDVVHDGHTIRKLITEKESTFFENVKEIIVVALFYSGKDEYNLDLINMTQSKKDFEKAKGNFKYEHQPLEDRIKFYFISKMVVETCPYGSDFRETCMIVKHQLDCVHEFYDAKHFENVII